VVIAAAQQFHAQPVPGLVEEEVSQDGAPIEPTAKEYADYRATMVARLQRELPAAEYAALASGEREFTELTSTMDAQVLAAMTASERAQLKKVLGDAAVNARIKQLSPTERKLGAMLVERDANQLAKSLGPLAGGPVANLLFGVGVVGMTLSTITLLMLISGFVICELLALPTSGWPFRIGCLAAAVGVLGPFIWSRAGFALAIPTSVFGFMLLPIAYLSFFLLMNQKSLLGNEMPRGTSWLAWNVLMLIAAGVATVASVWSVWQKAGMLGMAAIAALLGLALVVQLYRWMRPGSAGT